MLIKASITVFGISSNETFFMFSMSCKNSFLSLSKTFIVDAEYVNLSLLNLTDEKLSSKPRLKSMKDKKII